MPEADALDVIAGYTLLNDLSARDYQFKTPQWMPGKVFDGAAPCGPALVTPDEAGPPDAIEIGTRLNGEVMQSSTTGDLIHSIPALVAYLSRLMTLEPGDIVATGTPSGVGSMRDPRVWLKAGDEVEVFSEQLGVAPHARTRPSRLPRRRGPSARASRSALRRADQMATLVSRPSRRASVTASVPGLDRHRRTDWSRLRSNCSAIRMMPHEERPDGRCRPCAASAPRLGGVGVALAVVAGDQGDQLELALA